MSRRKSRNKMKKLTKKEILKFLEDKGLEYKLEEEDIVLKHCIMTDHEEKWHTIIWFEESQNDWFFVCQNPRYDAYDIVPVTEFIYRCEHEVDAIRNKNRK